MMRKLFWGCTAAGVVAAGGLVAVDRYGARHPDSRLGRCAAAAAKVRLFLSPSAALASLALHACHTGQPDPADEVELTFAGEGGLPPEPCPVQAAPGPEGELFQHGMAAAPPAGACEPAAIVIPDDDPPPAPVCGTGVAQTGFVEGADVAVPDSCPKPMPYCDGDEEAPPMPKVEDILDEACTSAPAVGWIDRLVGGWLDLVKGAGRGPSGAGECREDVHHHRHYPGCPYTGRSADHPRPQLHPCRKVVVPGAEECGDDGRMRAKKALWKLKKMFESQEDRPTHSEVDTMEYRRSDGNLHDYGPGGPL